MPRPTNSEQETLQDAIILLGNILKVPIPPTREAAVMRDATIKSVARRLVMLYERRFNMPAYREDD